MFSVDISVLVIFGLLNFHFDNFTRYHTPFVIDKLLKMLRFKISPSHKATLESWTGPPSFDLFRFFSFLFAFLLFSFWNMLIVVSVWHHVVSSVSHIASCGVISIKWW